MKWITNTCEYKLKINEIRSVEPIGLGLVRIRMRCTIVSTDNINGAQEVEVVCVREEQPAFLSPWITIVGIRALDDASQGHIIYGKEAYLN